MTAEELFQTLLPLFPDGRSVLFTMLLAIAAAIFLTPLEYFIPAYSQPIFYRKNLVTDLCYWFLTPILTRCLTAIVLVTLVFGIALVVGFERLPGADIVSGFGPLATLPFWLQCLGVLIVSDFADYWTHRKMHKGSWWKIHAVHHSPEEMNWISSSRVHPLNDLITRSFQLLPILLVGFSTRAILSVVPLVSFYVMFLHSNIRWGFGPLRWVFVSPAYHRWHHTSDSEGLDKNFAGIFPIWDLLFGTAHFPDYLPKKYGLVAQRIPESLRAQLVYPFRRRKERQFL